MPDHPRRFSVERRTSGVTWSTWTLTYHRTLDAAKRAAEEFLAGRGKDGRYSLLRTRPQHYRVSSYALIRERKEGQRRVSYTAVEKVVPVGCDPDGGVEIRPVNAYGVEIRKES